MWTVESKRRGVDEAWEAATAPFPSRAQAESYIKFVAGGEDDIWEWRIVPTGNDA